jgi:hypothetical protein
VEQLVQAAQQPVARHTLLLQEEPMEIMEQPVEAHLQEDSQDINPIMPRKTSESIEFSDFYIV